MSNAIPLVLLALLALTRKASRVSGVSPVTAIGQASLSEVGSSDILDAATNVNFAGNVTGKKLPGTKPAQSGGGFDSSIPTVLSHTPYGNIVSNQTYTNPVLQYYYNQNQTRIQQGLAPLRLNTATSWLLAHPAYANNPSRFSSFTRGTALGEILNAPVGISGANTGSGYFFGLGGTGIGFDIGLDSPGGAASRDRSRIVQLR